MRYRGLFILLVSGAAFVSADACRQAPPPRPPAPVDLAALKPKFEFRGRILFQSDFNGNNDIYLLTRDGLRRLTDDPASDEFPKWSPDGRRIAFSSNRSGRYQIYVMNEDGTGIVQVSHSENDAGELLVRYWCPHCHAIFERAMFGVREYCRGCQTYHNIYFGLSLSLLPVEPQSPELTSTG